MGATRYATRSTTQSVSGFFISPHQPKCPFVYFASASQTNSLRVKDTHIPLHQQNKKKVPDGVPVPANSNRRSVDQMGRHGHAQGKIIFFLLLFTAAAEATRRQFRRVWRTFQWQQRVRGAKSSSSRCCRSSIFEFGGVETVGVGGRMAPGPRRRTGMRLGGLPNI